MNAEDLAACLKAIAQYVDVTKDVVGAVRYLSRIPKRGDVQPLTLEVLSATRKVLEKEIKP